jgi:LysR family transcriptional regulator, positive regulator for ilvC
LDNTSLKLFLHLSKSLHFGKTGRVCNISPSALSRQIQRMENEVGHPLFERDNRMVRLTPAGLLFKGYAQTVIEKWQDLLDELAEDQQTLKGEISIYCSVTASLSILPELLGNFRRCYPKVHIRLKTGDAAIAVKKVIGGDVDIAVTALPDRFPKILEFKVLTQVYPVFIAPKVSWEFSDAFKTNIPWAKTPMILSSKSLVRKRADQWFKKKKIQPNIYAQVAGNEAILAMVALGCGVGIVPGLVVANSPIRDRIITLDVKPPLPPYDVGVCVKKRKIQFRLVRAFWEKVP